MVIKNLRLHNFGVYAGDNEFAFNGEKPIVLIGGMNGRGKTTFLEAVLLALYGPNSFAYVESNHKSYLQYLRSFVNRDAEDQTCRVELEFEINMGVTERYVVRREWDAEGKRTKEQITVYKDGVFNEFLTNNWPMLVENILPSALASFFFFDGEKIAELAVDNSNVQLKNSIKAMLGISVLDVLNNDIQRNLKKQNKSEGNDKSSEELTFLREEKENAIEELRAIDEEIVKMNQKIVKDNDALENLHQLYTVKGGDAVEKRQEILKKRAELTSELSNVEEQMYDMISDALPLALVEELISDIKLQAMDEHSDSVLKEALNQLDELMGEFTLDHPKEAKMSMTFMNYVKRISESRQTGNVYGLSDQALYQINNLVERTIQGSVEETSDLMKKKKKLSKQVGEVDSYLLLDINDNELKDLFKKIKACEQKVIDDKVKMAELQQARIVANSKVMSTSAEFSKYVEAYLATAELRDSTERVVKYSNMALNVIERFRVELQKRKTNVLAATITECYLKLANKKNLINEIKMDATTLEMTYTDMEGNEIPKDSLSAGEQQLMVISILWALALCSKKRLPVIIDTPLSRLDSSHRTSLIKKYFPNASEQTIILSTDTEIDDNYYTMMKKNIGDEFTLRYDENTKSTSIERGYMIGG